MKQQIDARGWDCPRPIIETKKLLDAMREGTVTTTVDNKLALSNLINFSESMGYGVSSAEKEGIYEVQVTKEASAYDELMPANGSLVIQISGNTYGAESDGLGESLMKAYIYALTEAAPAPDTLMFVNKGIFLTTEGSPVLDSLAMLEEAGTEILTCGACLDFFGRQNALLIGQVTNMYAMVEKLNGAGSAIKI